MKEGYPAGRDHPDVHDKGIDGVFVGFHHARVGQALVDAATLLQHQSGKRAVALAQGRVGFQHLLQVPVKEAEFPHIVQDALEVAHLVGIGEVAIGWRQQQGLGARLVLQEQLENDLFLVAEMVVEVAGADAQFGGNVVGGDIAFAPFVEQALAFPEDLVAGLHAGFFLKDSKGCRGRIDSLEQIL